MPKTSREEFVRKSNIKHNNKYTYEKVIYINGSTKVTITCATHGDFNQLPSGHLFGFGCKRCTYDKKILNQSEIISRFIKVHGNRYDYSNVCYSGMIVKVPIICRDHGVFHQTPDKHLQGNGCSVCGVKSTVEKRTRPADEFVSLAKEIHNGKYSYSKVTYINSQTKVTITCPVHGDFEQTPNAHLRGSGCKQCAMSILNDILKHSPEEFLQKAIATHGDKYKYNKVTYLNTTTKVTITCPVHGDFDQTPASHLSGNGCRFCMSDKLSQLNRHTTEEFLQKAIAVHGDKYKYDKAMYTNNHTKVIITCPKHGDFLQRPADHVRLKQGCPTCKSSRGELLITDILNKHNINYIPEYKVPYVVSNFRYDFYLPDYNLLIEFHGIQHYKYIPFFHANNEDNFLAQKTRDHIKKCIGKCYRYRYLEISYKTLKRLTVEQFEEALLNKINN